MLESVSLCVDIITDYTIQNLPSEVTTSLLLMIGAGLFFLIRLLYKKNKEKEKLINKMKEDKRKKEEGYKDALDDQHSKLIKGLRDDMNKRHVENLEWQGNIMKTIDSIEEQQKEYQDKNDKQLSQLNNKTEKMVYDLDLSKKSDIVILRDRINYLSIGVMKNVETDGISKQCIDQMSIIEDMFKVYKEKGGNSGVESVVSIARKKVESAKKKI